MKNRRVFRPAAPDALESRLALSQVGTAPMMPAHPGPLRAAEVVRPAAPDREVARFEARWMGEMIGHHGMAIRMARLALRNSGDPAVRELARGIIRAQVPEVLRMQGWLAAGYGVRGVRPQLSGDGRAMLRELASLRGTTFDRSFLREMIAHHRGAIQDATELLDRASHPGLRRLGMGIITTQAAEIRVIQAMLGDAAETPPHMDH